MFVTVLNLAPARAFEGQTPLRQAFRHRRKAGNETLAGTGSGQLKIAWPVHSLSLAFLRSFESAKGLHKAYPGYFSIYYVIWLALLRYFTQATDLYHAFDGHFAMLRQSYTNLPTVCVVPAATSPQPFAQIEH
eukprot:1633286-Pleurochrysis_carterae.AAC.4